VCKHLARKYHLNVTGTDVDPEMIQFAKENIDDIPHIRFLEMDATKMSFEDNEFDIVLFFGIMHHIGDWGKGVGRNNFEIVHKEEPKGVIMKYHSLVFQKIE
jgi:ubiquinone/menaquinone biosynthesis C-methylase UbiE